jgi:hypothetical protein
VQKKLAETSRRISDSRPARFGWRRSSSFVTVDGLNEYGTGVA